MLRSNLTAAPVIEMNQLKLMETQLLSDRFIYSNSYYSTNVLKTQKGRFKPVNNETNFLSFDASYDKVNGFSRPKRKCYNETWDNIHFQKAC